MVISKILYLKIRAAIARSLKLNRKPGRNKELVYTIRQHLITQGNLLLKEKQPSLNRFALSISLEQAIELLSILETRLWKISLDKKG